MLVQLGMFLLPLAMAALFVGAARASAPSGEKGRATVRAAAGVTAILLVGAALALSGALAETSRRPPPFMLFVALCTAVTVVTARSSLGARIARLPLWALVGAQGFRLPLELVMHDAAEAGVMPPEMTFGGLNYDIVTGATALALAVVLYRGGGSRAAVMAWNVMGSVLLAVIVGVAVAATPFVRAFGSEHLNTWVLYFPYVWLPTILVQAALFGHLVVFRRLSADRAGAARAAGSTTPAAATSR